MNLSKILKGRRSLFYLFLLTLLVGGVVFFLTRDGMRGGVQNPISSQGAPPVVVTKPELTVLSVDPPAGSRQSVDGFTPTSFRFSAPIAPELINIYVVPIVQLNKTVYPEKPDTLYVEPARVAWADGTSYTFTIKAGSRGVNGEELREDYMYTFSNKQPDFIELQNPI